MSEEDFLKRWSRRKSEVAAAEKAAPQPAASPVESTDVGETADAEASVKIETLLPLESITELSDVTAYLKAGVPADLTRAALRRVWTVDPSIRDFIGLAENAWDFTDPSAMPGFGHLEDTEDIRRLIAQVIEQIGQAPKREIVEAPELSENSNYSNAIVSGSGESGTPDTKASADEPKSPNAQIAGNEVLLQSKDNDIASQHIAVEADDKRRQFVHRGHGRALPR